MPQNYEVCFTLKKHLPKTQMFSLYFCLSSGSHFNPPFTLAIYLCGGMELKMVAPYLACQLVGGMLGAAMAKVNLSHFCVVKISISDSRLCT